MNWLSGIGSAGLSYLWYWLAAVITAVAVYVGVINVDNVRLKGIVYNYNAKSEQYREHLADSVSAEQLRHEFVQHVNEVMTIDHAKIERLQKETYIRKHFIKTNMLFNLGTADIVRGARDK